MSNDPEPGTHVDPLPWVALAAAGFFLLSYPWLSPFVQRQFVLGIPLFFVFEFGVWALLILVVALRTREG
jgi:hypothetical protein